MCGMRSSACGACDRRMTTRRRPVTSNDVLRCDADATELMAAGAGANSALLGNDPSPLIGGPAGPE